MLISPWGLSARGVLGINSRNRNYIGRYNNRRLFPLVDNKLQTKLLAEKHKIAMPGLYFVVREQHEITHIERQLADYQQFVIKPAKGSGGKGIWVIVGRNGENFIKASGTEVTLADIRRHMSNTLAGLYSLAGTPDVVLIEDLIHCDESISSCSHEGVPDVRVIVFQGYPVMAMLRLATRVSDGKANLHQGAVGVGLDIASGRCLHAVQFARTIQHHPDTGMPLPDIKVADWQALLLLAARCADMTGLGYLGVDLVIDSRHGAQLLELNARPGLSIQVANGMGLQPRLTHIEKHCADRRDDAAARVDYVVNAFADKARAQALQS